MAVVWLLCPASPVLGNDDQLVYSEYSAIVYGTPTFNNGWQDNGWGPRYNTNSPTHSGTNAYCLAPSSGWQAIKFVHGDIDTSLYTSLVLWVNGGATGGQTVGVSGCLDGAEQVRLSVGINGKLPTNAWMQVTLPLTSMGVANKTNFDGVLIWSNTGSTQAPFYVDDIRLVAALPPATVHLSVNATQAVRTVDARLFGVNTAAWDGYLDSASTLSVLTDMDNQVLRWPGGSWGDVYFMTNEFRGWGSYTTNFIRVATNTHAQVFFIVNYGSGTAQQAADWVRMCNVTNKAAFKYWEVGNECGGGWETDYNTNAPYYAHDPWTYAMRFTDYYNQMKAVDPTIKIGMVAEVGEDNLNHVNGRSLAAYPYTNHPAINPRTGQTHYGWTPVILAYLRTNGITPDFLVEHKYAPTLGDTWDLMWCNTWAADAAGLRQMLADYLGSSHTNVELVCTEHGSGGDRQRVSLVGGLFYADSIGQIMKTEFDSCLWWDLRNGRSDIANPDNALYGWRTGSSGYYYYDEGIVYGTAHATNRYPTFYCAKLMKYFARGGDTVIGAASDYPLLAGYGVRRTNGSLALLVITKSSYTNVNATISLNGFRAHTNAVVWSYGIPQDEAARTGIGSADIVQTNALAGASTCNLRFPPYSATVVVLAPEPPTIRAYPSGASGEVVIQLQGQSGVPYVLQSITNGGTWLPVATNTLVGTAVNYTNSASVPLQFWRAVWQP